LLLWADSVNVRAKSNTRAMRMFPPIVLYAGKNKQTIVRMQAEKLVHRFFSMASRVSTLHLLTLNTAYGGMK
jgi:hypothetical protein